MLFVVWKDAGRFAGRSKVSTWIFGIAYRKALKTIEKSRRNKEYQAGLHQPLDDARQQSIDGLENDVVNAGWVESGLAQLPAEQRLVMELTFFLGLSYPEIALIADCPVNTVKTRMFHARQKLRNILPRTGAVQPGAIQKNGVSK